MSDYPLISVIIPVYNSSAALTRCVESVIAQSYPRLEIVLVDDGSTDGSGELCDQFASSYRTSFRDSNSREPNLRGPNLRDPGSQHPQSPRNSSPHNSRIFRIIHQPNQGLSAARNSGLEKMTGQLVTFIDSDDSIDPEMLSALYRAMNQSKVQLSACNFQTVSSGNPSAVSYPHTTRPVIYSTSDCLTQLLLEQNFPIMACGKLYHRTLFNGIHFPVGKLYEDVGTTYRLVLKCPEVAYLPQKFYHYYQNPASIIHQNFSSAKLDLIELTDQMCGQISGALSPQPGSKLSRALSNRRVHARFSILRQLILIKHLSASERATQQEIITYLKSHRDDILKNPISSRRDRFAMKSLLLGLPFFKLSWRLYQRFRR